MRDPPAQRGFRSRAPRSPATPQTSLSRQALIRRHLEEPPSVSPADIWMSHQALIRGHLEEPRACASCRHLEEPRHLQ
jgi:hypothetical protein